MKKFSLFCVLFCALALYGLPALGDTYVSGPVSGTWTAALSPYIVLGNLEVPTGQSLNIQPGVRVLFTGHYRFTVHGQLTAIGTQADSIVLTHQQPYPTYTWAGLFFETAVAPAELAYCVIEWSYAQGSIGTPQSKGGGIHVLGSTVNVHHSRISNNIADAKGGGIYLNYASGEIYNNLIAYNTCNEDGGGIFMDNTTNVYIHDCEIKNNTADAGAGVHIMISQGILDNLNVHHNNATVSNGGGFYLDSSSPSLRGCKINNNSSSLSYGAGIYLSGYSNPMIVRTEICFNNYSALYCGNNCDPIINNCTIYGNGSYIIRTATGSNPTGNNNIMLGSPYTFYIGTGCSVDMAYSDIQIFWPGQGNFNNVAPFFVNSYANDFNLMPYSPCIDAGNPSFQLDPDGSRADMGAHYFDHNQPQGTCSVTLAPIGAPIILPPQGGTVWFTVLVQNTPNYWNLFDGWITLQQPDSQIVPLLNRSNLYLPPAGVIARTLTLLINSSAMPGTYTVRAYVGDYPSNIEDWDSFTFVKSAGADNSSEPPSVVISDGEITETVPLKASVLPSTTRLLGNRPDPFNPATTINFELRAATTVNLKVYDTAGRLVTTLVNGWRQAGGHEVTFDGSGLASGVYLYALQTDGYRSCGKMTLLK
jgi:hypothetical protein